MSVDETCETVLVNDLPRVAAAERSLSKPSHRIAQSSAPPLSSKIITDERRRRRRQRGRQTVAHSERSGTDANVAQRIGVPAKRLISSGFFHPTLRATRRSSLTSSLSAPRLAQWPLDIAHHSFTFRQPQASARQMRDYDPTPTNDKGDRNPGYGQG
ncbi:hypothetical protein PUNSTDRAFT_138231 [Punctularia strigosozonata HHB-11173 SS5]|uniref:Uncharacterized protein n=1 Tax=Punctularia strigosozonata (strain HHB-11173) TaxID=741275 RepID=R7S5C7_PUNST|nr:uncharacterized protein PUNSTDRAFT_138231 [Punctularia strigosozonata HHB-11173 SS5]EIN04581.1 hypothetical protein PUNSTDRAFT_138231 [Punctularia strigosozonata HHB-11173 SS5]